MPISGGFSMSGQIFCEPNMERKFYNLLQKFLSVKYKLEFDAQEIIRRF